MYFKISFIWIGDLWLEEVKDKVCDNHVYDHDVSDQLECQEQCKEQFDCVGISYSHKEEVNHGCLKCFDYNLIDADHDFGFYRRPGKHLNYNRFDISF